jgi:glycosyltransferase involved in cell wall biosynthesis
VRQYEIMSERDPRTHDQSARAPSALTVAIDTGSLVGERTGVGQFTQRLLDGLATLDHPPTVLPYVLSMRAALASGTRRLPYPAAIAQAAWGRADHPRADRALRGAQVVHGPNYVVPPTELPTVVSVHDCWFLRNPDLSPPAVRRFGPLLRRAIARGAIVHVPSTHTLHEAKELLGAERVEVLPLGAPPVRQPLHAPTVLPGLDGRPYVLSVGAKEPRKNLPRLVEAFGLLSADHPALALALLGPEGPDQPAIDAALDRLDPAVAARILLVDYVEDDVRDVVIANATALAFPSLDEGWGIPPLEAMSLGVPVVAARAGSLPEVCADAAEFVDPLDAADIAEGLSRVVDDVARRADLVARGRARVNELAAPRCAARFASLYATLALEARR